MSVCAVYTCRCENECAQLWVMCVSRSGVGVGDKEVPGRLGWGPETQKTSAESWEQVPKVEGDDLENVGNFRGGPRWDAGCGSEERRPTLWLQLLRRARGDMSPELLKDRTHCKYLFTAGMLLHTCTALWMALPQASGMVTGSV